MKSIQIVRTIVWEPVCALGALLADIRAKAKTALHDAIMISIDCTTYWDAPRAWNDVICMACNAAHLLAARAQLGQHVVQLDQLGLFHVFSMRSLMILLAAETTRTNLQDTVGWFGLLYLVSRSHLWLYMALVHLAVHLVSRAERLDVRGQINHRCSASLMHLEAKVFFEACQSLGLGDCVLCVIRPSSL